MTLYGLVAVVAVNKYSLQATNNTSQQQKWDKRPLLSLFYSYQLKKLKYYLLDDY